jgi:hypothetical protein
LNQKISTDLNMAVLVVSCDNYADLWAPFFTLFARFWPDCPHKVYLLSNFKKYNDENIIPLAIGKDLSWSDNLISALDLIDEEYVLLFIEDLFLVNPVKSDKLQELFSWMARAKPNYVKLSRLPKPDAPHNALVGVVSPGTLYRASTVMTVWKKEILKGLLAPGENAWEFEVNGTERSNQFGDFYGAWRQLMPVYNCVIKGKWRRSAIKLLASLGATLQLEQRKTMTLAETVVFHLVVARSKGLQLFPTGCRKFIKTLFSPGASKYGLK